MGLIFRSGQRLGIGIILAACSAVFAADNSSAPFYQATQDLLQKQERLAAELDAIAEAMIKATANDSPARQALASAKQNFDTATTAFRQNPSPSNRDYLESARRQLLKATSEFSDIDIDVAALSKRQSEAQQALNSIDTELARLQKTLDGIRSAEQRTDADQPTRLATTQASTTQAAPKATPTSAAKTKTSSTPKVKRIYPADAKPVTLGPNFTMLVTPMQVQDFKAQVKRQTQGQSSRSQRTFRVVTQRADGQTLTQDYTMSGLGAGFYISKLKLRAGQNRFMVGGQQWQFTFLPSEENKGYMLVLNSSERPAKVTLYPVALAN